MPPDPPPPPPPSKNLNPASLQCYLRTSYVIFDVKKGKASFVFFFLVYISLASGGFCPQTSLVKKVNVRVYFCLNARIWINLGEKYGTKFGLLIYYSKNC